jgi:hypothetical protein
MNGTLWTMTIHANPCRCTPALGYLPRDPGLLHSKPAPPPVPDLSFDFHYPSKGGLASPASESGAHSRHLRSSSLSFASSRGPLKGVLHRNSMQLNHGAARSSPVRSELHPTLQSLSAHSQPASFTDPNFMPLRTSVETMAAAQAQLTRSSINASVLLTAPATSGSSGDVGSGAQLDGITTPVASGSTPHVWGTQV